jgi:hypothetical protein
MTASGYRFSRHLAAACLAASVVVVTTAGGQSAGAAPPSYAPPTCPATGVNLVAGQPTNGGTLQVARIAAPKAGGTEKWDLKYDPWLCNKTGTSYSYASVAAEFLTGTTVTKTVTKRLYSYETSGGNTTYFTLPANSNAREGFFRPGEPFSGTPTLYSFPLPGSIRFTITLKPTFSSTTRIVTRQATYPVAVQATPGPVGGFFFPLRQASLPSGAYYYQQYHDDWNLQNRYALDIGAQRWDSTANAWTPYRKPNTSNPSDPANDHHNAESWLIWGNTVRAMSDGEVVGCVRGAPDNKPWIVDGAVDTDAQANQVAKFPGGNYLWVRTGNQTQVYAHFQHDSIPFALCPFSDNEEHKLADPYSDAPGDAQYQIKAGQFLGYIGNSGNTSNPHTHVESIMGTSELYGGYDSEYGFGSDSRPMNFINLKVQPIDWGAAAVSADWYELTSARVIPYNSLISPSDCGYLAASYTGKKEVVQVATKATCWSQMYNAMVQAGFRPVHYDSHPTGTTRTITTVWRPSDGTSWVLLHGLDATGLQSNHDKYTAAGWRYLNLQSYTVNGAARYAVIFVKQPGASQFAQAAMSLATFTSVFNTQTNAGYRMVDYSVAVVNNVRQYTGLWAYAPSINSYIVKDVTVAGYQTEYNTQTAAGRMPVSLDGFELNGAAYLATIWYGRLGAAYSAQHAMTSATVGTSETTNLASDRYARTVTEYADSSTHHFAAVWRGAPSTSITGGPSGTTTSTSASFSFNSPNDKLATFECRLDGGRYAACTSPKAYSSLSPAAHTFYVRARDFQGVRDATPATRAWTIS